VLLRITTTHRPARDLGYLLHKNPERAHAFDLTFGKAHVFYPEASDERCTMALLLEVDPVRLARGTGPGDPRTALEPYVNDRPYAASSFLSVAIAETLGSALHGTSRERPELAATAIPLEATVCALPCRGGESLVRGLFEPLGYVVEASRLPLDPAFPAWGDSVYHDVTLRGTVRLQDLLGHLYVLVPVLDDRKHYYVGEAEVEKLLRHGEGWLAGHPQRDAIVRRYLGHRRSLARLALARLLEVEEEPEEDDEASARAAQREESLEEPIRLAEQRAGSVLAVLRAAGARSVADLGCGEGKLLRALLEDPTFERVAGVDASTRALEIAEARLRVDRMAPRQRERLSLLHGALTYRDRRLQGFDAATLVEVVEHLDPPRLAALERSVFEFARPGTVVVTTPNVEFNVHFEGMAPGAFRHPDHRFEWTRAEFATWTSRVASAHGYDVRFLPVGREDARTGAPTQMAVFTLRAPAAAAVPQEGVP
jgi:3' terminal RNA ribose 2'-O-methyltransferase Hen1